MTTVLEAINAELTAARLYVSRLEYAKEIFDLAHQGMESQPTAPRHNEAKRVRKGSDRRNPTRGQVRDYIIANAPLTRGEIVAALDGSPQAIDCKLKCLLADGEIGADGRRGALRYRSPDAPTRRLAPVGPKDHVPPLPILPPRGVYPLYDAIVDLNGATTEQLARHLRIPTHSVVEQGRRLLQLGLVHITGVGKARMWQPAPSETARDAA